MSVIFGEKNVQNLRIKKFVQKIFGRNLVAPEVSHGVEHGSGREVGQDYRDVVETTSGQI
jgi:hypothetical protein